MQYQADLNDGKNNSETTINLMSAELQILYELLNKFFSEKVTLLAVSYSSMHMMHINSNW